MARDEIDARMFGWLEAWQEIRERTEDRGIDGCLTKVRSRQVNLAERFGKRRSEAGKENNKLRKMMKVGAKRVVVAMSGGVDSSVAAALLKEKGFEVIGITLKLVPDLKEGLRYGDCCSAEAVLDAKKVAFKLGIPHYTINLTKEFSKFVIGDFLKEYAAGRTPNPCIKCNFHIKFGTLLKKAIALKADFLATGHYARVSYNKTAKRYQLKKGLDPKKDQAYALYSLTQQQLKKTLFPLGQLKKEEVRALAVKYSLAVAEKAESMEICFVPNNDYAGYLKKNFSLNSEKGNIVDAGGKILGTHSGIINYTIGQRKGLGIAAKEPLYVTAIDKKNNIIVAGKKEEVTGRRLYAKEINFVGVKKISGKIKVTAKIRYRSIPVNATARPYKKGLIVEFEKPQWAITPGQAVVLYKGAGVIGGGLIVEKLREIKNDS